MVFRIFGWSVGVTIASLAAAFLYGGWHALALCAILGVLEVSLSFDNAVVNATVLQRMSDFWQKIFLTIGILIAVFGMRLAFPLLIVGITANLGPIEAVQLAMEKGDPHEPGTYGYLLAEAHPQIAAFGSMFLLMLFLDFIFEDRDIKWLSWLERPLARIGRLNRFSVMSVVVSFAFLGGAAAFLAREPQVVLIAGALGLGTYLAVNGLSSLFDVNEEEAEEQAVHPRKNIVRATGKAAFFLFLYLEVLDASFSFDGVIGAFAITSDPVIIALGLGLIGAMFVRSITVYLVRQGTLGEYVYLEHGAHWAIGALALILVVSIGHHVNEVVTGLLGVAFIGLAFLSSLVRNKRSPKSFTTPEPEEVSRKG